ncbi:CpXC domain-containing protein [Aminipila sp.]|uniref:CpXC domain-containing protein n=1 Tax=Aminipila sp. TaxID=2060095 RepID=UPI002897EA07|nr:CpXC domain-containing protein [Aminipila sp.]
MSKCITNEVLCPECGNKQNFVLWQNIIADLDPQLKEKVLNGELFVFTCEKCGKRFPITYPCLYHDMEKHLMVYLAADKDDVEEMNKVLLNSPETFEIQARQGYIYRAVGTVNELAEKIMIHDMKLDDRVIEIIKMLILFKSGNEGMDVDSIAGMFYYPGKEHKHEMMIMFADGRQSLIPIDDDLIKETKDNLKERIEEHTEEGYQSINVEWVSKILS